MSNPNSVNGGAVLQFLVLFISTLVSHVTVLWRRIMIGVGVGKVLAPKKKGRLTLDFQCQSKHYPHLT